MSSKVKHLLFFSQALENYALSALSLALNAYVCVCCLRACVRACASVCLPTSSTPAHEAQVVEAGHLVLHHGRGVPQLGRVVLVVSGHHRDQSAVGHVTKSHDLHAGQSRRLVWVTEPHAGRTGDARKTASGSLNIKASRAVYLASVK